MKRLRMLSLAAAAAALIALAGASSASGATLETTGVTTLSSETITASLDPNAGPLLWSLTGGSFANACSVSHMHAKTLSPFTGTFLAGPVESTTFTSCTRPVTVHKPGMFVMEHIAGTTNATVRGANTEATVSTPIGTLTCTTGFGAHIGTLTGVKHGHATLHIDAVVNCGFLAPSARWDATYIVTSPTNLGVSA